MDENAITTKFETIVLAAAEVLAFWGLSRTKVQDIAAVAKVAPGTVYLYADSKESLFDLALRYGMGVKLGELGGGKLPYSATKTQTVKWLSEVATVEKLLPNFLEPQLLSLPLTELLENLFDFLDSKRYAVRIVERSAHEWNELAFLFFERIREPVIGCIFCRVQHENPSLSGDECGVISRLVGGTIAFAAVHRFFEGGTADTTDANLYRKVTIESLVRIIRRDQEKPR